MRTCLITKYVIVILMGRHWARYRSQQIQTTTNQAAGGTGSRMTTQRENVLPDAVPMRMCFNGPLRSPLEGI